MKKKKTAQLSAYMKARAAYEKLDWKLTDAYLENYFNKQTRLFFGVTLDDNGRLLSDDQQPEFFRSYHAD